LQNSSTCDSSRKNPGGICTPDDYATWRVNFGSTFFTGSVAGASANTTGSGTGNNGDDRVCGGWLVSAETLRQTND
jgi:hypothetical protein